MSDMPKEAPPPDTALVICPTVEILDPVDPGDVRAIWKSVARAAIGGDMRGAEVARRWVRMRQRVLRLDLAPIDDAAGVARAQAQLLALVATGAITTREGRDLSAMVENRRKAIETLDFEPQLHALNEANRETERQRRRRP
jgi:hypothetical protein